MTRMIWIASCAALALTAPAAAKERNNQTSVERPQKARQANRTQRVERAPRSEARSQRAERPQRVDRQRTQRAERPQRVERQRTQKAERPQRVERHLLVRVLGEQEDDRVRGDQERVDRDRCPVRAGALRAGMTIPPPCG